MFHVKHSSDDTITAIATPPGIGGVGMIRISGAASKDIISKVFHGKTPVKRMESHKIYQGWIINKKNSIKIDNVLAVVMKGPNSYTGEDVSEIHCHGGTLVLRKILGLIVESGARLAEPGEFTKRAFLNGKIDLAQAEAIIDVISARSDESLISAAAQLEGAVSKKVKEIRDSILGLVARVEAGIDFPDDVGEMSKESTICTIEAALEEIERLLSTAKAGRMIREGVRTAIIGKPNVGKSSLLNALLGEERAIVTEQPGTTRDTIEESFSIDGLPIVVIDTAGIRHPRDKAEEFGVERTKRELKSADLAIVVLDSTRPIDEEDEVVMDLALGYNALVAVNKIDVGRAVKDAGGRAAINISALTGEGIEGLKKGIIEAVGWSSQPEQNSGIMINERHKECLLRAKEWLERGKETVLKMMPQDLIAIDLKGAIESLGEVNGESVSDEVVKAIFERFCVGK